MYYSDSNNSDGCNKSDGWVFLQKTKMTLIIVMGAVRPVAGLKKAEIRHGTLVSRKRKFAKLTGIWVRVRVHKKK